MTVGIGVMCEDGGCIVLASDMRVTFGRGKNAPHHDRAGKQYAFPPFNFAGVIAGSTSSTHAVCSELANQLTILLQAWVRLRKDKPQAAIQFEHIRDAIETARKRELRRLQRCAMENWGVSLEDWIAGKLPTGEPFNEYALRYGLTVLQRVKDDLTGDMALIVAGFLRNQPIFFRGIGSKPVEESASPAIHVIGGAGANAARQVLLDRNQHAGMGIARTLLHVYEALKAARQDKGVGEATGYLVMRPHTARVPNGMQIFHPEHPTVIGWSKKYALRDADDLESRFANDLVNAALLPNRARKFDWLGATELMPEL